MEQVYEGIANALRAMLGLLFVVGPGVLIWLVVASLVMGVRWVAHRGPFQRAQESQGASSPSTVKS